MNISNTIKKILKDQGRSQAWTISRMNEADPVIKMDRSKFSAIVCGSRKMTGDELIAFCKATGTNPDKFLDVAN